MNSPPPKAGRSGERQMGSQIGHSASQGPGLLGSEGAVHWRQLGSQRPHTLYPVTSSQQMESPQSTHSSSSQYVDSSQELELQTYSVH